MALTTYPTNPAVVSALPTWPSASGYSAPQMKAFFDQDNVAFKAWFNGTHLPELEVFLATGLNPAGEYNALTAYPVKSVVGYNGSSYVTLQAVTGVTPTNDGTNYMLIASKGDVNSNVLINGAFQVNQRAVTGTVTLAAGVYGHDMWKAGASGCTYTFASSGGVTTLTISAGSLIQIVEGINLETDTYCMSWSGTAQGKIGAGAMSASGITGAVTGGTNLSVEFGTGTLADAKLEQGTLATAFIRPNAGEQLTLCKRYLRDLAGLYRMGYYTSDIIVFGGTALSDGMRIVNPSLIAGAEVTAWQLYSITGAPGTGFTVSISTQNTLQLNKTSHALTDAVLLVIPGKVFASAEL